jgi:hypothetical protein
MDTVALAAQREEPIFHGILHVLGASQLRRSQTGFIGLTRILKEGNDQHKRTTVQHCDGLLSTSADNLHLSRPNQERCRKAIENE